MSCVLTKAVSITAANAPTRPAGSMVTSTAGPRSWLRMVSDSALASNSFTVAACAAKSGWCSTVYAITGTIRTNSFHGFSRQLVRTCPIFASWALRADELYAWVPCHDMTT